MTEIIKDYVSRETYLLLEQYVKILLRWNQKINLISRKMTEEEIWKNHVLDSLVLSNFVLHKNKSLADIGSGAGFPGLILAINGHLNCCLIEKHGKKSSFLKAVIIELGLKVRVRNECASQVNDLKADYICSRAVTSIPKIIALTQKMRNTNTEYILHTGYDNQDIDELQKIWNFELQEYVNPYRSKCKIVSIKNIIKREV